MAAEADTRTRLIDATVDAIDRGGEAAVRMRDIAERVGIKQPSIYHYFETSDRLIEAAQGERWARDQAPMAAFFRHMFDAATSAEEFFATIRVTLERIYQPDRWVTRRQRFNVLGSSFARPDLLAVLAESQHQVEVQVAAPFRDAQAKRWLRSDIDASVLLSWIVGQLNGRIYVEIAPGHFDLAAWDELSIEAVLSAMGQPPDGAIGDMPLEAQATRVLPPIEEFTPPTDADGPTRDRAVAAAVEILVSGGEASLRMREVAERVGVREPSLYHFFTDRDALVVAAQARRWRDDQMALLRMIGQEGGRAETRADFLDGVWATLRLVLSDDRAAARRCRAEILGSAQSRPELLAEIVEYELLMNAGLASVIERAKGRGWVRRKLDSREFAVWFFGMVNGRLFAELDPDGTDLAGWDAIAAEAVFAVLGYPHRS